MTYCPRCGQRNVAGAPRCKRCGLRLDLSRPQRKLAAGLIWVAVAAWHLHQDDNLGYSVFAASVTIAGLAAFYRAYRRDPTSLIPEVAAKTWKGALLFAAFLIALMFAFLPLPGAIAMALILPFATICLFRVSDRIGLRISGPFARRCSRCSAPVAISAHYCPLCGCDLKRQTSDEPGGPPAT